MSCKIKAFILVCVLVIYVLSSAGCAVLWFLAGAGTAATVGAVMEEQDKEKAKK
jgi:hypothetical protein